MAQIYAVIIVDAADDWIKTHSTTKPLLQPSALFRSSKKNRYAKAAWHVIIPDYNHRSAGLHRYLYELSTAVASIQNLGGNLCLYPLQ